MNWHVNVNIISCLGSVNDPLYNSIKVSHLSDVYLAACCCQESKTYVFSFSFESGLNRLAHYIFSVFILQVNNGQNENKRSVYSYSQFLFL